MQRIFGTMATAALLLTAFPAGAQTATPDQGQPSQTPMQNMQNMPMMQGQQGSTMPGQQSAPMGCPMMKQMAMLQERVQQLEQKTGIPSPTPSTPQVQ